MPRSDTQEIFEKTRAILADVLGVEKDEITPESTLIGDLGAESIDFLDISFRIEKEFGVKFPQEELGKVAGVVRDARVETISGIIQKRYNVTLSLEEKESLAYLETEALFQKIREDLKLNIGPEVIQEAIPLVTKQVVDYLKGLGFSVEMGESYEAIKNIEDAHPITLQEQVVRMLNVQSLVNYIAAAQPA